MEGIQGRPKRIRREIRAQMLSGLPIGTIATAAAQPSVGVPRSTSHHNLLSGASSPVVFHLELCEQEAPRKHARADNPSSSSLCHDDRPTGATHLVGQQPRGTAATGCGAAAHLPGRSSSGSLSAAQQQLLLLTQTSSPFVSLLTERLQQLRAVYTLPPPAAALPDAPAADGGGRGSDGHDPPAPGAPLALGPAGGGAGRCHVDVESIARDLLAAGFLVQLWDEGQQGEQRGKDARHCLQQLRHRFVVCIGAQRAGAAAAPGTEAAAAGGIGEAGPGGGCGGCRDVSGCGCGCGGRGTVAPAGGAGVAACAGCSCECDAVVDLMAASEYLPDPLIVEPRFRDQFFIAKPTRGYGELLQSVPECFVGTAAALEAAVGVICGEMEAAFKQQGLPVPPWRRRQATMSKWAPQQLAALSKKISALRRAPPGAGGPACAPAAEPPAAAVGQARAEEGGAPDPDGPDLTCSEEGTVRGRHGAAAACAAAAAGTQMAVRGRAVTAAVEAEAQTATEAGPEASAQSLRRATSEGGGGEAQRKGASGAPAALAAGPGADESAPEVPAASSPHQAREAAAGQRLPFDAVFAYEAIGGAAGAINGPCLLHSQHSGTAGKERRPASSGGRDRKKVRSLLAAALKKSGSRGNLKSEGAAAAAVAAAIAQQAAASEGGGPAGRSSSVGSGAVAAASAAAAAAGQSKARRAAGAAKTGSVEAALGEAGWRCFTTVRLGAELQGEQYPSQLAPSHMAPELQSMPPPLP